MQWLADICIRRPIFAFVLILVFVVVGAVGYKNLGVDKFPKVDFPLITIITPYPGASPSAVETDVTEKVEEAVNTVNGLDSLTSTSTEGVSMVIAQFALEVDPDKAAQDINEHLATILLALPTTNECDRRRRFRWSACISPAHWNTAVQTKPARRRARFPRRERRHRDPRTARRRR